MEFAVGIVCGIILSFIFGFGPAFFGLIQNSIQYGFRKTMLFVVGVLISDLLIVLLMLTVLSNIDMNSILHNVVVASVCGTILVILGIHSFRRKVVHPKMSKHEQLKLKNSERLPIQATLFLHGLSLNLLNPVVWLYWISIITFITAEIELQPTERYIFFSGLLLATFGCDTLKCRLASLLQNMITPRIMRWFNRLVGVCLMAFGIYLIVSMIMHRSNPNIETLEPSIQNTRIIQNMHNRIRRDSTKRIDDDTVAFGQRTITALPVQPDTLTK